MEPTPSVEQQFLKKLIDIIDANLHNEQFGVNELATELGMSRITLHRKVKSVVKKSVSEFIRETRLKRGYELLQQKAGTVSEISYKVGFGSVSYFNRCFHDQFGFPPGEVLKGMHPDVEKSPAKNKQSLIQMLQKSKILYVIPVVVLLTVVVIQFLKNQDSSIQVEKSIAVVPFKNLSNDTLNQYRADGMKNAILTNLSKIKDLRVITINSVEQYRKSDKTAADIGREHDVAYLLEGSFLKEENQIRLIVQLIRTKDEDLIWSNNYDRKWEDIFSLQSEVAEKVASELQAAITPEEKQLIRKVPTINLTAYDFYQRGREKLTSMWGDYSGYIKSAEDAERLFLKALELDSTFALAYSGMATAYYAKNRNEIFAKNFLDSMFFLANKALSFDPQLAEAIMTRGDYYLETDRPDLAMKEYHKALKLNPNDWLVYWNIGAALHDLYNDYVGSISNLHEAVLRNRGSERPFLLGLMGAAYQNAGFIEKAKQCFEQKFELTNDSSGYLNSKFWLMYEVGDYENAFLEDKRTGPSNPLWGGNLLLSILSGHDKESYIYAINAIEWVKKNNINTINDAHRIGYGLWVGGKLKEAEYYFDMQIENDLNIIKAGRLGSSMKTAHYDLAAAYAMKGDKEKAYQYLDELNKKKSYPLFAVNLIKHDPLFNSLRDEPRFQAIVKDIEAKYQAEHDRVGKWLEEQGML